MVIKLNTNREYKLIPEGKQLLKIVDAKVTPSGAPQQIQIKFEDGDGASMLKTYKFEHSGAMYYFGTLLSALGIGDGETFDTNDVGKLINTYVIVDVIHTEYNGKTYADVSAYEPTEETINNNDNSEENIEYPDTSILDSNDIDIDGL